MQEKALLHLESALGQPLALRVRRQLHGGAHHQPRDGARQTAPQALDALLLVDLFKRLGAAGVRVLGGEGRGAGAEGTGGTA